MRANTNPSKSLAILTEAKECLRRHEFGKALDNLLDYLQEKRIDLKTPEFTSHVIAAYCILYKLYLKYNDNEAANQLLTSLDTYLSGIRSSKTARSKQQMSEDLLLFALHDNFQEKQPIFFETFLKYSLNKTDNINTIFDILNEKFNVSKEKKLMIAEIIHEHAEKFAANNRSQAIQLYTFAIKINLNLAMELALPDDIFRGLSTIQRATQDAFFENLSVIEKCIDTAIQYSKSLREFPRSLSKKFMELGRNMYNFGKDGVSDKLYNILKTLYIEVITKSVDPYERTRACINAIRCFIMLKQSNDSNISEIAAKAFQLSYQVLESKELTVESLTCERFADCAVKFVKERKYAVAEDLALCALNLARKLPPEKEMKVTAVVQKCFDLMQEESLPLQHAMEALNSRLQPADNQPTQSMQLEKEEEKKPAVERSHGKKRRLDDNTSSTNTNAQRLFKTNRSLSEGNTPAPGKRQRIPAESKKGVTQQKANPPPWACCHMT